MTHPYFLLLLPLLFLYWWFYRREEPQRGVFSTFFLWDLVLQEENNRASKNKIAFPWLEWLALTALIFALTRPFFIWKQPTPSIFILLDASLSMETKDRHFTQTRFERAIQWMDQQSFPIKEVFCFPQQEKVLIPYTDLDKKCTSGTLNESDVFEVAQQYKKNFPQGKVIWLSDRPLKNRHPHSSLIDQEVLFGTPETNNAGIVFARVKGFSSENILFVLLHNWAPFPQKRQLRIHFSQEIVYEKEILLPARSENSEKAGEFSLEIPFVTKAERLTLALVGEDSLSSDDVLWLNPSPTYKIYVEEKKWAEGALFKKFLTHFPHFTFVSEAQEADVAISTELTKASWTICIPHLLKAQEGWAFGSLENARVTWQKQDPILEGISWVGKEIENGYALQKKPLTFISYVETNALPILGEYKHPSGGGWFFWGIPLARKMLDTELGFFLCNLLEREFMGSPLSSHFLISTSQKWGWRVGQSSVGWRSATHPTETDNRGESRFETGLEENRLQESVTIFLETGLLVFAAFCLWLSWFFESRRSFLFKR